MIDYMSRPEEVSKNPGALKMFQHIANGDKAVFEFLWRLWNFEHVFDDLIDEGKPTNDETKEQMFKAVAEFVDCLLTNPFVQNFATDLRAMLLSSVTRCLDGDKLGNDPKASVLRCGDIDIVMHVAYLHRGWDFMRTLNTMRIYDKEDE